MSGIYRHYKGSYYRVLHSTAYHTDTLEKCVVYKRIYTRQELIESKNIEGHHVDNNEKYIDSDMWIRPYDQFYGKVQYMGNEINRFTCVLRIKE